MIKIRNGITSDNPSMNYGSEISILWMKISVLQFGDVIIIIMSIVPLGT
jgi:hypothetical protein